MRTSKDDCLSKDLHIDTGTLNSANSFANSFEACILRCEKEALNVLEAKLGTAFSRELSRGQMSMSVAAPSHVSKHGQVIIIMEQAV